MLKAIPILLFLFALGCMSDHKSQEQSAVYNEVALKEFVFATADPDKEKSLRVLDSVLANAAQDSTVFFQTIAFLEKPFGDPNSAYRNEDLYSGLLQAKMKSEWIDSTTKTKIREKLYLLMQNRPESMANDFTYVTPAGFKKKMYDVHADYTLLFFYNPECEACKEMKVAIVKSEIINRNAKVLAVYTDRDEKVWLDHLNEMPDTWLQGRDENEYLYTNSVYNLKAIPTIYLLDKDKKVLLKDCTSITLMEQALVKKSK